MSQPDIGYSVVRKVKQVAQTQEEAVDVVSTPPDLEMGLDSLGGSLFGGHCTKQVESVQTSSPSLPNRALSDETGETHYSGSPILHCVY